MTNVRFYGEQPYTVAVVHGGPGAPGSVAAVARELARDFGVLEPLQTATSLDGQIEELYEVLRQHASLPVTLIGHSWGAWLVYLLAARHPEIVAKLILVGSGAFKDEYVRQLSQTRMSRLTADERTEFSQLIAYLHSPDTEAKDEKIARLGELAAKADDYAPFVIETDEQDMVKADGSVYYSVWNEAARLRRTGELLEYARALSCPVVAIHGDYDSSPAMGVQEPLTPIVRDFRFITLEQCGHSPWKERHAYQRFYQTLREEIVTAR